MRYVYLVLAIAVFWIGLPAVYNADRSMGLQRIPRRLAINQRHLRYISGQLREYRRTHGRYPANDEGLAPVASKIGKSLEMVTHDDPQCFLRAEDGELISIWGEPFVYENRRGLRSGTFIYPEFSRTDISTWAARVDDDVYVWSVAARKDWASYQYHAPRLKRARQGVLAATTVFALLYILATVRAVGREHTGSRRLKTVVLSLLGGGALAVITGLIMFPTVVKTCYVASVVRTRRPELTKEYVSIISKYHSRGIIGDTAYGKIMKSMEKEP